MIFDITASQGRGKLYLYKAGDERTTVTGGWKSVGWAISDSNYSTAPKLTKNSGNMVIQTTDYQGSGAVIPDDKIDLTHYKTLVFEGSVSTNEDGIECILGIWEKQSGYYADNVTKYVKLYGVTSSKTLDVSSLSGEYVIGFAVHRHSSTSTKITVKNLYLK